MSSMFQSLSALITAESILMLCSNCLAYCHKRKLHYTLNDNSKHNDCFVCNFLMFCDVTLSDWLIGPTRSLRWTQSLCWQLSESFTPALAVERSKGLNRANRADPGFCNGGGEWGGDCLEASSFYEFF